MAAVGGLEDIALGRQRRHARARPDALDVDDDERDLHHVGQADAFLLERHPRPGGAGHRLPAGQARSDGHVDGGDLVLGVDEGDLGLPVGELVHDL